MTYTVGSLINARGREWVVLPESAGDLLMVRPLGGTDDEVTGIYLPLEADDVRGATFSLPDPARVGDARGGRLLRDAARLTVRNGAGPFRSFARVAVEPRPYQLVPLLMALRLDTIRLLIADDVGIGKTVEAGLVARELYDRGEIKRLTVLCPPPLAEQWQRELAQKFNLPAELVLPGTAARLERQCRIDQSIFEVFPVTVVSTDFIKSDRRRSEFLRACPEFVIVDEAHTCAAGGMQRGSQQQRHRLLTEIACDPARHLLLVTATPHSGDEGAFRSLLGLLDPAFGTLPEDLSGPAREADRGALAMHFIQRRRADIRAYLDTDTPFPKREETTRSYALTPAYRAFLDNAIRYAQETVRDQSGTAFHRRIRWWSTLALLRSLASSPAAAVATLRNRATTAGLTDADEVDAIGRRTVLDTTEDDTEGLDLTPGSDPDTEAPQVADTPHRRRLLALAHEAERLQDPKTDAKLAMAIREITALVRDGFHPIVFCRFIPTAQYVADALRKALPKATVEAVTGLLPHAEREARVAELGQAETRVLVATDCLSEGINLQEHFDAVFHYDLAWNPTRHEQREGRVDRYGQPQDVVRTVTYYGTDNGIDGIVLDVLIRRHRRIREDLGISVPVPMDTDAVVEAIFEGLLLREQAATAPGQLRLEGLDEYLKPRTQQLDDAWRDAAEREKRSRTLFAQRALDPAAVGREWDAARAAAGSGAEVRTFVTDTVRIARGTIGQQDGAVKIDLRETPRALRDMMRDMPETFTARFALPVREGEVYLHRTHPAVEGLAAYVLDTALDPVIETPIARRCGAIRSGAVRARTTVLVARLRYALREMDDPETLAEEIVPLGFTGAPERAEWLVPEAVEPLLGAMPEGDLPPDLARRTVEGIIAGYGALAPALEETARMRAESLREAHRRVRTAAHLRLGQLRVTPLPPVDILGVYVLLPVLGG